MPLYITQLILPKKQNPTAFVDDMTKDFMNEIRPSPRYVASKRSRDHQQTAAAWFLNRQT